MNLKPNLNYLAVALVFLGVVVVGCAPPPGVPPGEPLWAGEQSLDFYAGGATPQVHCQLKAYVSIDLGYTTMVVVSRIAVQPTELPCGLTWGPTLITGTCTITGARGHTLPCGGPQGFSATNISARRVWSLTRVPESARVTIDFDSVIAGHTVTAIGNTPLILCGQEVCRFQKI